MHELNYLPNGSLEHRLNGDLLATVAPEHIEAYCDALNFEVPDPEEAPE